MIIDVIGIGLEGQESLTHLVQKRIDQATVLVGSRRHLSYFLDQSAEKIEVRDFTSVIDKIKQLLNEDHKIVILATGDPLFFGIGRILLEHFSPNQLNFYPHLSCVQLAFNRLKIPSQDAQIVSVHGRDLETLIPYFQKGIDKIAILTDGINHPAAIAQLYLRLNIPCAYQIHVCENLGDTLEKTTTFLPNEILTLANKSVEDFSCLNVVILIRQASELTLTLTNLPLLGIQDQAFLSFSDRHSLMTKKEIRTLILGELALQSNQIIWDIGSGTGSVAIEMARLSPTSQIYAIEKSSMGIHLIEKNCQKFQVNNIIPVQSNAPQKLASLPSPHRIFIGGSSGKIEEILNTCQDKLQEKGIIVMALATLENCSKALTWFQENHWNPQLLQINISRSLPIADLTRFSPLNPVTLITASRSFNHYEFL